VIIITAFDDARSREQAESLGCVAYLRKPCDAETILALLGELRSAH
jgi:CheY-like chemotaxis protein